MDFTWVKFSAVELVFGSSFDPIGIFLGITICLQSQIPVSIIPEYHPPHPPPPQEWN